jgi:hypothetical protein
MAAVAVAAAATTATG